MEITDAVANIRAFDTVWSGIALLQVMDIVWTVAAIRLAGAHEANPAMQHVPNVWLWGHYGPWDGSEPVRS